MTMRPWSRHDPPGHSVTLPVHPLGSDEWVVLCTCGWQSVPQILPSRALRQGRDHQWNQARSNAGKG